MTPPKAGPGTAGVPPARLDAGGLGRGGAVALPRRRRVCRERAGETPAHPGPAFGGVGVCVSHARLDAAGGGEWGAAGALSRRRRAWRKRAGRMPAVPGPAFGGVARGPPSAAFGGGAEAGGETAPRAVMGTLQK